jgi:membrane protein required for colicin V production
MTWVDGVVLAVLLISAGLAYFRGLVREVLGVGAWVGAVDLAVLAEPLAGRWRRNTSSRPGWRPASRSAPSSSSCWSSSRS